MSNASDTANLADFEAHELEARLRAAIERRTAAMPAMIHCANEAGELLSVSDVWLSKLGYSREEALGRRFTDLLTAESRERAFKEVLPEFYRAGRCENVRYKIVKKDGGALDVLLSAALADDLFGRGRVSLAVVTDVTALTETTRLLAEANHRLHALAAQDELTGLADRRAFEEALGSEYQRARRDDGPLAVVVIEVDGFEAFKELHGRSAGDDRLKFIAGAIGRTVRRAGDIAARHGGAVFAVLLPGAQEAGGLSVALRIRQALLRQALDLGSGEHEIPTVSMGVAATWPATELQETLVQNALLALSLAKLGGGNTIVPASAAGTAIAAAA